jgi:hypothetical protein
VLQTEYCNLGNCFSSWRVISFTDSYLGVNGVAIVEYQPLPASKIVLASINR